MVVSPQCPAGHDGSPQLPAVKALVEKVASEHRVDRDRLVATGISLGGDGALGAVGAVSAWGLGAVGAVGAWGLGALPAPCAPGALGTVGALDTGPYLRR